MLSLWVSTTSETPGPEETPDPEEREQVGHGQAEGVMAVGGETYGYAPAQSSADGDQR